MEPLLTAIAANDSWDTATQAAVLRQVVAAAASTTATAPLLQKALSWVRAGRTALALALVASVRGRPDASMVVTEFFSPEVMSTLLLVGAPEKQDVALSPDGLSFAAAVADMLAPDSTAMVRTALNAWFQHNARKGLRVPCASLTNSLAELLASSLAVWPSDPTVVLRVLFAWLRQLGTSQHVEQAQRLCDVARKLFSEPGQEPYLTFTLQQMLALASSSPKVLYDRLLFSLLTRTHTHCRKLLLFSLHAQRLCQAFPKFCFLGSCETCCLSCFALAGSSNVIFGVD